MATQRNVSRISNIEASLKFHYDNQNINKAIADVVKLHSRVTGIFGQIRDLGERVQKLSVTDTSNPLAQANKDYDREVDEIVKKLIYLRGLVKDTGVELAKMQFVDKNDAIVLADLGHQMMKISEMAQGLKRQFGGGQAWGLFENLDMNLAGGNAAEALKVLDLVLKELNTEISTRWKQNVDLLNQPIKGPKGLAREFGGISRVLRELDGELQSTSAKYSQFAENVDNKNDMLEAAGGDLDILPANVVTQLEKQATDITDALQRMQLKVDALRKSQPFRDFFKMQFEGVEAGPILDRLAADIESQMARIQTALSGGGEMAKLQDGFLGGSQNFDTATKALRAFAFESDELAGKVLTGMKALSIGTAKETDKIQKGFIEVAQTLNTIPAFAEVVDMAGMQKAQGEVGKLETRLDDLLGKYTAFLNKAAGKDIGQIIAGSTKADKYFSDLRREIDITRIALDKMRNNAGIMALLPPGSEMVLAAAQQDLTKISYEMGNIKNQVEGASLENLKFDSVQAALSAMKLTYSQLGQEINGVKEGIDGVSRSTQFHKTAFEAAKIDAAARAYKTMAANMRQVGKELTTFGPTLDRTMLTLSSMGAGQMKELFGGRPLDDGSEQSKRAIKDWENAYGRLSGEIKKVVLDAEKLDKKLAQTIKAAGKVGEGDSADIQALKAKQQQLREMIALFSSPAIEKSPEAFRKLYAAMSAGGQSTSDLASNIRQHANKAINELGKESNEAQAKVAQLKQEIQEMGTSVNAPAEIVDRLDRIDDKATDTIQTIVQLRQNVQEAMDAPVTSKTSAAIDDLATDFQRLSNEADEFNASMRATGPALDEAADDVQHLQQSYASFEHYQEGMEEGMRELGRSAGSAGGGINNMIVAVTNAGGPLNVFQQETKEINDLLQEQARYKGFTERMNNDIKRIQDEAREIDKLTREVKEWAESQEAAGRTGRNFADTMRNTGIQVLRQTGDFRDAHDAMVKFGAEYRRLVDTTRQSRISNLIDERGLKDAPGLLGRAAKAVDSFTNNLSDARREGMMLSASLKTIEKDTWHTKSTGEKLISNVVEGVFHGVGYEAINVLQMSLYSLKDFLKESNTVFMEFQQGMAEIYTIMPEASNFMRERLAEDIAAISTTFGYLQSQLLPAMYQGLSLGIKPEGVTQSLETAAQAARASVSDLEPTLETGQSLVNAYGGELYTLEQVYDQLFYTIKGGAVTMRDLNANMAPITAVAGDVGVALEDIASAIIVMSRQGDDMGTISQMLSNMLTQIQLSETALGGAFVEAAKTDFRSFIAEGGTLIEAMQLIDEHAKKTGQSIAEMVGGESPFFRDQQAMLAVLELTGKHLGDLEQASLGARDAAGLMNEAYLEVKDTMFLYNQQAQAEVEETQRQLGESMETINRFWLQVKTLGAQAIAGNIESYDRDLEKLAEQAGFTREEIIKLNRQITSGRTDHETADGDLIQFPWQRPEFLENYRKAMETMRPDQFLEAFIFAMRETGEGLRETENATLRELIAMEALSSGISLTSEELENIISTTERLINVSGQATDATAAQTEEQRKQATQQQIIANAVAANMGAAPAIIQSYSEEEQELWQRQQQRRQRNFVDEQLLFQQQQTEIKKILDGDTFEADIQGEVKTIRLTGVDTAEIKHGDEGKDMAFGRAGMRFTQDFLLDPKSVRIEEAGIDKFERTLASVFKDVEVTGDSGRTIAVSLEEQLAAYGLAIPVAAELVGEQELYERLVGLTRVAAEQGRGVFSNELVQGMYLEGSVTTMEDVGKIYEAVTRHFGTTIGFAEQLRDAYDELADADGEWVEGRINNAGRIAEIEALLAQDLTKDQRSELDRRLKSLDSFSAEYEAIAKQIGADLTDNRRGDLLAELQALQGNQGTTTSVFTGDAEAADKAREKIAGLREEIKLYFNEMAFNQFMQQEGGITEGVAAFGVALGLFDQQTADYALQLANAATATQFLVESTEFAKLSVEDQARAINLLVTGMATTAEEALGRLRSVREEQQIITSAFESGYGTQIYWDMANGVTSAAQTAGPIPLEIEPILTLAPEGLYTELGTLSTELTTLTETPTTVILDADPQPFDDVYADLLLKTTAYEEANPHMAFFTNHIEAETVMDRLIEKAEDREITYTYNVVVNGRPPNSPDGEFAGGGPIYPGTFLVGELGPELITMRGYGNVISNADIRKALGQGGEGVNIVVNIDARGADKSSIYPIEQAVKNGITTAMRRRGQ